jgi:myo-inositol 2-dehydrogenase/D-chiro-inositol 1-dehydrogenase
VKIRVGVIGAGYIGAVHAGTLMRDDRVTVAAICDRAADRAALLARNCGARAVESVDQLLETIDAVFITTPNTRHTQLALQSIAAGKHVFCEKPMATSVDEAKSILDATAAARTVFQVGHNRRFAPVYVTLRELLSVRGPAHSAHIKMNRGELINPHWVADPRITGGFLFETTIHMFDMMRFLFGEVAYLDVIGSRHEYPEVDDFSAVLKFTSGFHTTLASSADASWLFPFESIEVYLHHATIVTREMESITISEGQDGNYTTHSTHQLSKEEKWGYTQEDRAFVDSIFNDSPASVTALDGFQSVMLVDAFYRAVESGNRVTLGQV